MCPSPSRGLGVLELRMKLDYKDLKLARCKAFYEECRVFAKRYLAAQHDHGPTALQDRKGRRHFTGQNELAEAFLDQGDRGTLYWPSDKQHRNYNSLQYKQPQHATKIKYYLGDLLFRIHQQAEQNARYKEKNRAKPESEQKSATEMKQQTEKERPPPHSQLRTLGSSISNPIDLEDERHQEAVSAAALKHERGILSNQNSTTKRSRIFRPLQLPDNITVATGPSGAQSTTSTSESSNPKSPHKSSLVVPKIEDSEPTDPYSGPDSPIFPHISELDLGPPRRSPKRTSDPQPRPATPTDAVSANAVSPQKSKRANTTDTSSPQKRQKGTSAASRLHPDLRVPERRSDRVRHPIHESLYSSIEDRPVSKPKPKGAQKGNVALVDAAAPAAAPSTSVSAPITSVAESVDAAAAKAAVSNQDIQRTGENATAFQDGEPAAGLEEQRRVPVAPMAVASAVQPVTPTSSSEVARRSSPPAPELGTGHLYMEPPKLSLPSTESVQEETAASPNRVENTQADKMTPTLATPSGKGEALLLQGQKEHGAHKTAESPPPHKLFQQGVAVQISNQSPPKSDQAAAAAPTQQPDVRIVVRSRLPKKTRSYWTPTHSLRSMSLAQLKKEIPLVLSPDFCGFKFGFVCPDSKTVRVIQDGNELDFEHMKMDMFESIEEYMEEMEGSGAVMIFQLRIEEMRDMTTLERCGSSAGSAGSAGRF